MPLITAGQVLALAPDASAQKAGQGLASARKWQSMGRNDVALWGLCQGSGKDPYQIRIALPDFSSKCSCPSRKFPCKHALGLLLIAAQDENAIAVGEPPAFVREWLDARVERTERQAAKREAAETVDPEEAAKQAAKREAQRDKRLGEGVAELRAWIEDLVRNGFAHAKVHETSFWDVRARRLVDAQAPGLGRAVADLAGSAVNRSDWPAALLRELALLHLCAEAFERRESLDDATCADLNRVLGVPQRQAVLDDQPDVADTWQCLGVVQEELDRLRVQRTWLRGDRSGTSAVLLDFAVGNAPIAGTFALGEVIDATLRFFPASVPQRAAVMGDLRGRRMRAVPEGQGANEILDVVATSRCRDPWLVPLPVLMDGRLAFDASGAWWLIDTNGHGFQIQADEMSAWSRFADTGGARATWFCEWRGGKLRPVSHWKRGAAA